MDTVTYPDSKVREELANWTFVRVDISKQRETANLFDVSAIPMAISATSEGDLVVKVVGFLDPERFSERLKGLRN